MHPALFLLCRFGRSCLLHRISLFVCIITVHLIADTIVNDSTTYYNLRNNVLANDSANQTVPTADALAEAGLYSDAIDLLREYALSADTVPSEPLPVKKEKSVAWRWSSGIDYYHLEDFDTATMTIEEQRDYKRLTETPLSLWTRLAATVTPWDTVAATILPELYLSERKARFETALRYRLPGGLFEYEPMVKAEKWFGTTTSSHTPVKPDSTDMGGAGVRCNFSNHSQENRRYQFSLPVTIDWEHYRFDRPGYESFTEYRFHPVLELGEDLPPLRLSAEVQYEDYYRDPSEYLDVVRMSGRLEGSFHNGSTRGFAAVAWMGDRYLKDSLPPMINRIEATANGKHTIGTLLALRLRLRGIYEKEAAVKTDPALSGKELLVAPDADLLLFKRRCAVGLHLQWERRYGVLLKRFHYLWEGRKAIEPGLHVRWSSNRVEAGARAAFRYENIDPEFEVFTTDNRSFRANIECSLLLFRLLSLDGVMDYQFRRYISSDARQSENLSVSVNATVRW